MHSDHARGAAVIDRDTFAKINEVENISLSPEMKQAFDRFDAESLSDEERRLAIISCFRRASR